MAFSSSATGASWRCWKCGSEQAQFSFFCPTCKCIVDPSAVRAQNYFDIFDEEKRFDIDLKRLSNRFKELQKVLHPDKVVLLSEKEQEFAQDLSSLVNKAYDTLQRPLERGLYLLELEGKGLDETAQIRMEPAFLAAMMEVNEALSEMGSAADAISLDKRNRADMDELFARVAEAFAMGRVDDARFMLAKLQYLSNIDAKIRELDLL